MTVGGYFFGERTILDAMLLGAGDYRIGALAAETAEVAGDAVSADTKSEVEEQFPALAK